MQPQSAMVLFAAGSTHATFDRDRCFALRRRPKPATDQRRGVRQHLISAKAGRTGEITRLPDGIELVLEGAKAPEIVEMLAMAIDEMARPVPRRSERMAGEAGERRHAETETLVALAFEKLDQANEHEGHGRPRRIGQLAHQVD